MADTLTAMARIRYRMRERRMNSFIRKLLLLGRFGFFEVKRRRDRIYRESTPARAAGPDA